MTSSASAPYRSGVSAADLRGSTRIASSATRVNRRSCTGGGRSRPPRLARWAARNHPLKKGVTVAGCRQLQEQLSRRNGLGGQPRGSSDFPLGHAHRVVDRPRGVDPVEVQDIFGVVEQPLGALQRLVEGLAQGVRRPEDHSEPKLHEGVQNPAALPFRDPNGSKDTLPEGGGDVG